MSVRYETNRWGDKVATADDSPSGYVPAEDESPPMPEWMRKIFDDMKAFDPTEKT